jgi:hypothetical protein
MFIYRTDLGFPFLYNSLRPRRHEPLPARAVAGTSRGRHEPWPAPAVAGPPGVAAGEGGRPAVRRVRDNGSGRRRISGGL